MPVTGMTAPKSAAVEESGATEKSEPWSVKAIARPDGDAESNWRTVHDRPRWRRVIVTRCGCALRFNHIGTGVRARSSSKRECERRQCYQYKFFCHVHSLVVWPIEPSHQCEVAKENDGRADDAKTASSSSLQVELSCRSLRSLASTSKNQWSAATDAKRRPGRQTSATDPYFLSNSGRYASYPLSFI